uniref:Uncharacterized protein n=1 Tax=Setaria viridis TaxID=4556 RepID=A0A4U6SZ06_SETVI|nr:hypothetical protein SEVIR_9G284333v2 [Setaria viridis]
MCSSIKMLCLIKFGISRVIACYSPCYSRGIGSLYILVVNSKINGSHDKFGDQAEMRMIIMMLLVA